METNPKKSRALIITIIIIIVLLLIGFYLFFMRGDTTNTSGSSAISRMFSSLLPSGNSKDPNTQTSETTNKLVQAGENIKKGDKVYVSGTNADNNPIVMRVAGMGTSGTNTAFGFATQDMNLGDMGQITLGSSGWNNFWSSVSGFIGGTFGNGFGIGNGTGIGTGIGTGGGTGTGGSTGGNTNGGQGDLTPPDLIAGEITPTTTIINSPTTISSLITNQGQTSTGHSFLTLFTITNSNPSGPNSPEIKPPVTISKGLSNLLPKAIAANTSVELYNETTTLAGNSSSTSSISYSFNTTGIYYIRACADNGTPVNPGEPAPSNPTNGDNSVGTPNTTSVVSNQGSVTESNEANNCGPWTAITVTTTNGVNLPDLKAGPVTPISTTVDIPTKLSSVITNNGVDSTKKGFTSFFTISTVSGDTMNVNTNTVSKSTLKEKIVKLFSKIISVSKAIAYGDIELKTMVPILPGKTGSTAIVSYTFKDIGTYYVRACADKASSWSMGSIIESNENNNCSLWTTLTVTNALPDPGTSAPGAEPGGGEGGEYPECRDGVDNDNDGLIDTKDSGCHTNFDATDIFTYDGSLDDESKISSEGQGGEDLCPENPLEFTDEEKLELQDLLRKFYLLAPTIKTEDDIYDVNSEIFKEQDLLKQTTTLIADCKQQKADPSYKGPQEVKLNPYYNQKNITTISPNGTITFGSPIHQDRTYVPGYNSAYNGLATFGTSYFEWVLNGYETFERMFNVW
jgi:hypothetical protein